VNAALERARFVDGKATAGFAARIVKNNRQAESSDRSLETIRKMVAARVLGNATASRPSTIISKSLANLLRMWVRIDGRYQASRITRGEGMHIFAEARALRRTKS
jgi:hypothetical protein